MLIPEGHASCTYSRSGCRSCSKIAVFGTFGTLTLADLEVNPGAADGMSWQDCGQELKSALLRLFNRPELAESDTCDSNDRPRVYDLKLCKILRCLIRTMQCGINLINILRTEAEHRNKQSVYYVLFGYYYTLGFNPDVTGHRPFGRSEIWVVSLVTDQSAEGPKDVLSQDNFFALKPSNF